MLMDQEDNRTPPGFAVVHHTPHQLIARLVRQSERAIVYRLQLLAHAC